ncbi:hypothetical protein ED733_003424 [Metarhizium rileyi]|uniref:Uncharacterized protein n=1 Tax=Metarhizium rileyi (strain RCEF 4871) TaxID=1649241 RepID=A0A5C6GAL9_METRR|nr:hypothetical protein ED733_003424 [Metarhizium rileyi]
MARELSDPGRAVHDCADIEVPGADRKWSWAPGDDTARRRTDVSHNESKQGPLRVDQKRATDASIGCSRPQSQCSADLQSIEAKKESRRLRRNLKESGDYLGVQGYNPETGRLDVVTPTDSDRSSLSQETQRKLLVLRNTLRDARHSYKSTKEKSEEEAKKILLKNGKETLRRLDQERTAVKDISKTVKWKRHTRQWSSAQEPDLSPIAQSTIGAAENPHLDREPQKQDSQLEQPDPVPSLIDIGKFSKHPFPASPPHSDQLAGQSPDSTATVVRTPHRQSLADPAEVGSSAWELFENGISFDSFDEPVPANDLETKLMREEMTDKRLLENGPQPTSARISNDCRSTHTSDARKPLTPVNEKAEPKKQGTFLDIRCMRQEDPRGTAETDSLVTQTNRGTKPSIYPQKLLSHNIVGLQNHYQQEGRGTSLIDDRKRGQKPQLCSIEITQQELRKGQPGDIMPTQKKDMSVTGPRKRLMRHWGHWISRRKVSRNFRPSLGDTAHWQELHPSPATPAVVSLGKTPQIPDRWEKDLTSRLGLEICALKSELKTQLNAAPMARQATGTGVNEQPQPPATAGTNEGTIKGSLEAEDRGNITAKGLNNKQSVPVNYASTPITTTTGYDQGYSQEGSRANMKRRIVSFASLRLERQLSGMVSSLPLTARSDHNLGGIVTKPLQNSLLSEGQSNHGIETDSTSKERHIQKDQRRKRNTGPVRKTASVTDTEVVVSKQISLEGASNASRGLKKLAVHEVVSVPEAAPRPTSVCETKAVNIQAKPDAVVRERAQAVAQKQEYANQGPGSFPDSNVGHTGGDGCQNSFSGNRTKSADISSMATLEYAGVVGCHFFAFFLVYWEIVGPVFNSRSEYWGRHKRHESTLADCFALALALPGAILAVMGLV